MKGTSKLLSDKSTILLAIRESFVKLDPRVQVRNPIMFVVYLGFLMTTGFFLYNAANHQVSYFDMQIALWLFFTVLFANFAESMAESRGKAHADSLKKIQVHTFARVIENGIELKKQASELQKGDIILCEAGDIIPADGEVIEGIASVDESAITGESAPVIRESGGDRSAVTMGTKILSDKFLVRVTSEQSNSFLDRMIALIEGAKRQKTPNEVALNILLSGLTIIFLLVVVSLKLLSDYSGKASGNDLSHIVTLPVLVSLLVCLIPTTISGLLSAIGISGMDRLVRKNVVAKSGRSVEAAGDIDLLILDKTGTITLGNRMASDFVPAVGVSEKELAEVAQMASMSDETPEGRSIVVLAKERFSLRGEEFDGHRTKLHTFSAQTRMSGVDFLGPDGTPTRILRKGAEDAIKDHVLSLGGEFPQELSAAINKAANRGGTPLLVSEGNKVLGFVNLKDIVKGGIRERFAELRKMGIRTLMVTGDNPLTAAAIAAEAGVDDFIAQATPEIKLERIRHEQQGGRLVAMTGDGTNDAPALAQADVGVAMNTGTQASREAGNMVDLDSNPTKLIDVVIVGKQLLMTRGALTTFSIANDVAKYFAIIPALFGVLYSDHGGTVGPLDALNIMKLSSPESAILSTVIFNALSIMFLVPLALKGVAYQAKSASAMLRRNLMIYGLGGIVTPFIGIKLIDLVISLLKLA